MTEKVLFIRLFSNTDTIDKVRVLFILSTFLILISCVVDKGTIDVKISDPSLKSKASPIVDDISLSNDELTVTGSNFLDFTSASLDGNTLSVLSNNGSTIVFSAPTAMTLAIATALNFTINTAHGAAAVSVTFNLLDDSVTASAIADEQIKPEHFSTTLGNNVVPLWNGTNWVGTSLSGLSYEGSWNANTGVGAGPDAGAGTVAGEYYIIDTAGTIDLAGGPGTNSWAVGDWAIWNDTLARWEKVDNSTGVKTFNGRSGTVTATANDYTWAQIDKTVSSINDITDVDTSTAAAGLVLKYDGSKWVAAVDETTAAGGVTTTSISDGTIQAVDLDASLNTTLGQVSTNTATITTNISNISTNASNITNNSNSISTHTASITSLNSAIGTNTASITSLGSSVSTNASNISTNTASIASLNSSVATNASNIATNTASISALNTTVSGITSSQWSASGSDLYYTGGDISLGTSTPSARLNMLSDAEASGGITFNALVSTPTITTSAPVTLYAGDYIVPSTTTTQARTIIAGGTGTTFNVEKNFGAAITGETFTIYRGGLRVDNEKLFVQGGTGKVGIGTNTPRHQLHVVAEDTIGVIVERGSGAWSALEVLAGNDTGNSRLLFNDPSSAHQNNTGAMGMIDYEHNNDSMDFRTNSTFAMRINSSQNVGIGTGSPTERLEVSGNVKATAFIGDGSGLTGISGGASSTGTTTVAADTDTNTSGDIIFETGGTSKAVITNDGKFGIGVLAPTEQFQVENNQDDGTKIQVTNKNGAGTASYAAINAISDFAVLGLLAHGTGRTASRYGITIADYTELYASSGDGLLIGTGSNATPIIFGANSQEVMRIDPLGNVGIGTTTPSFPLDVSGNGAIYTQTTAYRDTVNGGGYILRHARGTQSSPTVLQNADFLGTIAYKGYDGDQFLDGMYITARAEDTPTDNYMPVETLFQNRNAAGAMTTVLKLSSNGSAVVTGTVTASKFVGDGSGLTGITAGSSSNTATTTIIADSDTNGTGEILFQTNGSTKAVVSNSGSMGIGVLAPDYNLDVNGQIASRNGGVDGTFEDILVGVYTGNTNETNAIQSSVSSIGTSSGFRFMVSDGGGASTRKRSLDLTRDEFRVYTNDIERMRINDVGDVGIGTSTVSSGNRLIVELTRTATSPGTNLAAGNHLYIQNSDRSDDLGYASLAFGVKTTGAVSNSAIESYSLSPGNSQMAFIVENGNTRQQALTINNNGNVGIGTTNPAKPLSVVGTIGSHTVDGTGSTQIRTDRLINYGSNPFLIGTDTTTSSDMAFQTYNGSSYGTRMTLTSDGNLGIGDSTPGTKLEVYQDTAVPGIIVNTEADANEPSIYLRNTVSQRAKIKAAAGLGFETPSGSERMTITSGGNVGIGSTNPNAKLVVNGTRTGTLTPTNSIFQMGGSDVFLYGGASDGSTGAYPIMLQAMRSGDGLEFPLVLNPNGGNVGINTLNPTAALDVAGKAKFESFEIGSNSMATTTDLELTDNANISTNSSMAILFDDDNSDSDSYFMIGSNSGNRTGVTEHVRVDSDGKMGIGTSTPFAKLSVAGTSEAVNDRGIFQITDGTGANTDTKITMGVVDSDYGWIQAVKPGTNYLDLILNPNGGKIGVGTISPEKELDVSSQAKFGAYMYTGAGATSRGFISSNLHYDSGTSYKKGYSGASYAGGWMIDSNGGGYGNMHFRTLEWGTDASDLDISAIPTRMVIKTDGKVGVGTTDPTSDFVVSNSSSNPEIRIDPGASSTVDPTLWLRDTSDGAGLKLWYDNSAGKIYFDDMYNNDTQGFIFRTKVSATPVDAFAIKGNGNIGIGTNSPAGKMDVVGSGVTQIRVESTDNAAGIEFLSDSAGAFYIRSNDGSNDLSINDGSSDIVTFKDGGRVGIGVSAPGAKLNVLENEATPYATTGSNAYPAGIGVRVENNSNVDNSFTGIGFAVDNAGGSTGNAYIGAYSVAGSASAGLVLGSRNAGTYNEGLRLTHDGSVGIGTSSPSSKLSVVGDSSTATVTISGTGANAKSRLELLQAIGGSGAAIEYNGQSGFDRMNFVRSNAGAESIVAFYTYDSDNFIFNGNIGIGTSTPGHALEVAGDIRVNETGDTSNAILFLDSDSAEWRIESTGSVSGDPGNLSFREKTLGTAMVIDNTTGNVGIGTISPNAQLEVLSDGANAAGAELRLQHANNNTGDVIATVNFANNTGSAAKIEGGTTGANNSGYIGFYTDNAGVSSERLRIQPSGNIGIGTTSPDDALDVVGDVDATGCFQNNNTGTVGGTCVSDERLKENIIPLRKSLDKVLDLRPVTYVWRAEFMDVHKKEGSELGLIAQEVEEVFPELVVTGDDGYKRVKYDVSLTLHLIQSIKEFFGIYKEDKKVINREIASLKIENEKLKEENGLLKEAVCEMNPKAKICSK